MYDELVKRLRTAKAVVFKTEDVTLLGDAADAIEELIEKLNHADDQIERLVNAAEDRRWIPATERLPDDRRDVQITVFWHDAWRTMYGYYDGAYWHLYAPMHTEVADVYVIGWMEKPTPMPLPQPKEK